MTDTFSPNSPDQALMDQDGWLLDARQVRSPNYGERPPGSIISLLVIHNISLPPGKYGGNEIEQFFCNQLDPDAHPYFSQIADVKVSAHGLIRRDGELVQFVPLVARAWHAGQSCFEGQEDCNNFSIGIELEGCDDEPYTPAQYERLIGLTQDLMMLFPAITVERIVGHEHIAPGRKTDPGPAFDWNGYLESLSLLQSAPQRAD